MSSRTEETRETDPGMPPASRGVVFLVGCLGFFYGLITVVDPLL